MRPFPLLALALAAACRGAEPGASALPNDAAPPGSPTVSESPAAPIVVRVAARHQDVRIAMSNSPRSA